MPFRRREQTRQIAFEEVDDWDDHGAPPRRPETPADPPDDVAPVGPDGAAAPHGGGGGERAGDATRAPLDPARRRRRRLLLIGVAGAVVLVLGGLTALDTVRARQADALLRTAPGGVVGLDEPPQERWSIDVGQGVSGFAGNRLLAGHEGALVAYDLASGEEAWRLDELAGFECNAVDASVAGPSADSVVTCLGGGGTPDTFPRTPPTAVAVVSLDGEVLARRDLDPARGIVDILPDGDLARAVRDDRGVAVTVEDARTGEVRWTTTVPRTEPQKSQMSGFCEVTREDGATVKDEDLLYFYGLSGTIAIAGCGVDAVLTNKGEDLSRAETFVQALRDGRLVRTSLDGSGSGSEVLDADGTPLWSSPGSLSEPVATDGSAPPLVFSQDGKGFVALDQEGRELWSFSRYATQVLLTTKEVTVFASYPGAVAVDTTTGEEVWSWKDTAVGGEYGGQSVAAFVSRGALTIAFGSDTNNRSRWVSLDLADGSKRWEEQMDTDAWSLLALGGELFGAGVGTVVAFD